MQTRVIVKTQCSRPKAQKNTPSRGKSLLSSTEPSSGFGESAAVHFVQTDRTSFSDESGECDDDHAVASTVETLTVTGCDDPVLEQKKETRSVGGIPSR